jgi:hypothetical protein
MRPRTPRISSRLMPLLLAAACASDGARAPEPARAAPEDDPHGIFIERGGSSYTDTRPVPKATDEEIREFNRIWELFRRNDGAWPRERDRFKRRSDAAGYLLAGHLFRFYMQANLQRQTSGKALLRAKDEMVAVGAPCAPALVDLMVLDEVPLPDGRRFVTDDLTRQDCLDMLERMGSQAAPEVLRVLERKDQGVKARRYLALAAGGTGDPRALEPLVALLREDPSWQVRADAATALGKLGDRRALEPLAAAVREDPDPAVVKRAGKARDRIAAGRKS